VQGPPGTVGNGAGSTAWALSFARVEPNTGITFTNNQCISNCVSLNLGDNDSYGWTVQDITLAGNQLAKSSLGIAMNYYATQIAMDAVYVNNVRLIDQAYAGGSSSALYMIEAESSVYAGQAASDPYGTDLYPSVGPNNVSTGYQVTVTVQHSGSNVTGAAVAITGQTPTGTTNSSGKCVLPVSTTSYASPITGYTPTSTSLNPVTITANTTSPAYSGSWTGTLSGDAAITIPIS